MLRIAVIDDDKTLLCDMHKLFDRFIIAYDFDFTVEYFSSCEDIYAKFKAGEKYDLLFLDIEFPEMKGTEFGLQLRRQMKNYDTQIVFYFYDSGLCHGIIQDSTDCFLDQANCL